MQLVEQIGVAVAGGDGKRGLAQRGIDGCRIREILLRNSIGLGDDGGVFAVEAQQVEEPRAQLAGVGRVVFRRGAQFGEFGRKSRTNPGRERGLLFGSFRDPLKDRSNALHGVADNFRVGVGLDGGDEVKIVAHRGLVGAHLRPLIADKADALGRREAGFNTGHQSRVDAGRISAPVVALSAGVGEEDSGSGRLQGRAGGS